MTYEILLPVLTSNFAVFYKVIKKLRYSLNLISIVFVIIYLHIIKVYCCSYSIVYHYGVSVLLLSVFKLSCYVCNRRLAYTLVDICIYLLFIKTRTGLM